jgi:enamine deaminase RidA (YjgF/YER057c/UK114 family)
MNPCLPHFQFLIQIRRITFNTRPGGWDPNTGVIPTNLTEEINQCFANIDLNLTHAGGKGWSQVFKITTYHVGINEETMAAMSVNVRKWMPDHAPLWTLLGVERLALPEMHVEIEVTAHDPEGSAKA